MNDKEHVSGRYYCYLFCFLPANVCLVTDLLENLSIIEHWVIVLPPGLISYYLHDLFRTVINDCGSLHGVKSLIGISLEHLQSFFLIIDNLLPICKSNPLFVFCKTIHSPLYVIYQFIIP